MKKLDRWHVHVLAFASNLFVVFQLSRRKTLGEIVFAAMKCRRVSIADLGRALVSATVAKHNIKRVWRFLTNPRVDVAEGARALLSAIVRASPCKMLPIALDWVDVKGCKVLRAAVPFRGRSIPILFASYRPRQLLKSQNALEEGFLVELKDILPSGIKAIILADRGFARASLAAHLDRLGLSYIIRLPRDVMFRSARYCGLLGDLDIASGEGLDMGRGGIATGIP